MLDPAENPLLAGRQAHRPAPARCPASRGWQPSHGTGIAIVSSFRRRDGDRRRQAPRRVCFRRLYLSPSRTGPAANRRSVASLTPVGVHGGRDLTPSRRTGESSARATRRPAGWRRSRGLAGRCVFAQVAGQADLVIGDEPLFRPALPGWPRGFPITGRRPCPLGQGPANPQRFALSLFALLPVAGAWRRNCHRACPRPRRARCLPALRPVRHAAFAHGPRRRLPALPAPGICPPGSGGLI
jgi:hypothetical protein